LLVDTRWDCFRLPQASQARLIDEGQFQIAADKLGVTQQAVSKRIATLERSLGVSLFIRSGRGAQLSVDGQAFLPHARELVKAALRAVRSVSRATERSASMS
jgi:DNA-binding transcriptional LysR family regulator